MSETPIPLDRLPVRTCGEVVKLNTRGTYRRRMLDLGFVPSSIVKSVRVSPLGDPILYQVRDTLIGLRRTEAQEILVRPLNPSSTGGEHA